VSSAGSASGAGGASGLAAVRGLLREGKLPDAVTALQNLVRSKPADAGLRIGLFQVYSLLGKWGQARDQIEVAGQLDSQNMMASGLYAQAITAEEVREQAFTGKGMPTIFGEPPAWAAMMLQAVKFDVAGNKAAAADLRTKAMEEAPARSGTVNGQPFAWIADADCRFGPLFEVIIEGTYYWVPMERVAAVEIKAASDVDHAIWARVSFTWTNGGSSMGLMPVRYPGTTASGDTELQLARATAWSDSPAGSLGLGQRMLASDQQDWNLLDIREITFNPDEQPAAEGEA
jgi:type VI secretion system protein ImpE